MRQLRNSVFWFTRIRVSQVGRYDLSAIPNSSQEDGGKESNRLRRFGAVRQLGLPDRQESTKPQLHHDQTSECSAKALEELTENFVITDAVHP